MTEGGVRISTPLYIDVPMAQRKGLLNGVREVISQVSIASPASASGIVVESATNRKNEVETFLGMSLDVLRSVLFQRGGLSLDLLLKLQAVSGYIVINEKEVDAALKDKLKAIKSYIKENEFHSAT